MRPKQRPGRRRQQPAQQREQRPFAYLGLLVLAIALPVFLTIRGGGGTRFIRGSPLEVEVQNDHWRGIAEGIPSLPRSEQDIHIVFSTDCSPYQNYQSILLFNSAEVVGQGRVTRVASGCSREEEQELMEVMSKQPDRFRVHFTPDYSWDVATGKQFMFYNKPNGMAHFLKYADPPMSEAVIALVDPDMILMAPLTPYVGDADTMLWHDRKSKIGPDWVAEGHPVAQYYGLGGYWAKWADLREITEGLGPDSPANEVGKEEAQSGYPVGPPYLLHPRDWARVVELWVDMCPKVYARHEGILAEMYGYCIAAAHIRLRHRVAYGMMVSDTKMNNEGWPLVDPLKTSACDTTAIAARRGHLPPVLHYCQMYRVGTYMFGKRHKSHHTFFTCDANSLQYPPQNYLSSPMGQMRIHPRELESVPGWMGVRQGYMVCSILRAMNMAQISYKQRYCRSDEISGGVQRFTDLRPIQVATDAYGR